ncbi:MAG: toll/interleukin-1 receptor domain-containing protein, partial [Methylococcus sp.]
MTDPSASHLFLSYSRNDEAACAALRSELERAGFDVFKDDQSIRAGDRWVSLLEQALAGCAAFVVLIGRDGVARWIGAEVQVALTRHLSPHDDTLRLPIFPILLGDTPPETLPPLLGLFQAARWSPGMPLPDGLPEAIRARASRFETGMAIEGCPFLGLGAFGPREARLFFGRRKETLDALAALGDQREENPERLGDTGAGYHRWLQVEGNSGSGKSSLVMAGLLPMIERGALWARTGFERCRVLGPMMPGQDPLAKLAEVLEAGLVADPTRRDSLERQRRLEQDELALAYRLRDCREDCSVFLLIVDQFEELFTLAKPTSRLAFDKLLAHALQDPDCPLLLITTVRADFLDRYELLPGLQGPYNSLCKRYFLPLISGPGLREAIEGPARLAGLDVSEVTTAMLEQARDEPGALPLVENALTVLWEQRAPGSQRLSGELYQERGGLAGLLSAEADALLDRIGHAVPQGRRAALELLFGLTRINDGGRHSRRRLTREEAVDLAGAGDADLGEKVVLMLSGERPAEA